MTKLGTNIAAWGTTIAAVLTAAIAFPEIAKTSENQRLNTVAKTRVEALASYKPSEGLDLWLDSKIRAVSTNNAGSMQIIPASDSFINETHCLAQAVYYEARSETRSGQRAVAEVVLNRVSSKHFPNSVCGVVFEGSERRTGCQFSFTCDGSMDMAPKGKSWERSVDVAEYVMSGGHTPITNRSTHYHTTEVDPIWSGTMRMTRHVGSHVFYRFAPRDYQPSEPTVLLAPPI